MKSKDRLIKRQDTTFLNALCGHREDKPKGRKDLHKAPGWVKALVGVCT